MSAHGGWEHSRAGAPGSMAWRSGDHLWGKRYGDLTEDCIKCDQRVQRIYGTVTGPDGDDNCPRGGKHEADTKGRK